MEPYLPLLLLLKMNLRRRKYDLIFRLLGLTFLLIITGTTGFAQDDPCETLPNEKVQRLIEKARNSSKYNRAERIAFIEQAYEKDDECFICLLEWGRLEFAVAKKTGSSFYVAKNLLFDLIRNCPFFHADAYYLLGAMAFADRDYKEAKSQFEEYVRFPTHNPALFSKRHLKQLGEIEEILPDIEFQLDFKQYEDDFEPQVVEPISFFEDEYLPALSPDGSLLFFTRRGKAKAKGDILASDFESFNMAVRRNYADGFESDVTLDSPFNTGMRFGGASISVDNLELYIAAQNPSSANPDNIDLFVTKYEVLGQDAEGNFQYLWGALNPLIHINTPNGWEAQPALSADGKQLYFASINAQSIQDDRGNPTMDIWMSERNEKEEWQTPRLMPRPINSKFNDKAPFLHPDGNTLYFSSDRSPNGGGYDIWYCHRDSAGKWEAPKNLGAPVNTEGDEHGLVVSTDGKEAFFASRRTGTKGLDILQFPVPQEFRPEEVRVVKGALQSSGGGIPPGAKLYLQYAKSKRVETIKVNENDGRFATIVRLDQEEDVLLISEADGLAFEAHIVVDIEQPKSTESTILAPIALDPPENGEAFQIGDIQYASSSAKIDRTSLIILEAFAAYLIRNEAVGVHIQGHTDNTGNTEENQTLSEMRAEAVAEALSLFGVPWNRISFEGFGETQPLVPNVDNIARAKNRRTEFEITFQR